MVTNGKSLKLTKRLRAKPGKRISLEDFDPDWTGGITDKEKAAKYLAEGVQRLARQQSLLYAQDTYSILLIFQAMDAAGKDGTIRHVMSGINPQGLARRSGQILRDARVCAGVHSGPCPP